jgi:hypothetical protein
MPDIQDLPSTDYNYKTLIVLCSENRTQHYIYETQSGAPVVHNIIETLNKVTELVAQDELFILYNTNDSYEDQTIDMSNINEINRNTWFFGKIIDQETGQFFYKWSSPYNIISD